VLRSIYLIDVLNDEETGEKSITVKSIICPFFNAIKHFDLSPGPDEI
jgi:hypothetical protein